MADLVTSLASEKFLAPACCKFSDDDDKIAQQELDRERVVCSTGILDTQFLIEIMDHRTGGMVEKGFNPRINSAACPETYAGKTPPERVYAEFEDPVELGKQIEATEPYDKELYAIYDPRLMSATTVYRDYACKMQLSASDANVLAHSVLKTYPDHYKNFLDLFVNVLFGSKMKDFLTRHAEGMQTLLDRPDLLNRISWSAYSAVRGKDATSDTVDDNAIDKTLNWNPKIETELSTSAKDGRAMAGIVSAQDVYDLRKGIEAHLAVYKEMTGWCKGYATKPDHAVALMWYCQEQGRNMCDDYQLLAEDVDPDDSSITLHVPEGLFDKKSSTKRSDPSPHDDGSVRKDGQTSGKDVFKTKTYVYSVGNWTGKADAPSVFLQLSSQAPYAWGFGHCCNVYQKAGEEYGLSPFHKYRKVGDNTVQFEATLETSFTHLKDDFVKQTPGPNTKRLANHVTKSADARKNVTARELLVNPTFRAAANLYAPNEVQVIRNADDAKEIDSGTPAGPSPNVFHVPTTSHDRLFSDHSFTCLNTSIVGTCDGTSSIPFLAHGAKFSTDHEDITFDPRMFGCFDMKAIEKTDFWRFECDKTGRSPCANMVEQSKRDYGGLLPLRVGLYTTDRMGDDIAKILPTVLPLGVPVTRDSISKLNNLVLDFSTLAARASLLDFSSLQMPTKSDFSFNHVAPRDATMQSILQLRALQDILSYCISPAVAVALMPAADDSPADMDGSHVYTGAHILGLSDVSKATQLFEDKVKTYKQRVCAALVALLVDKKNPTVQGNMEFDSTRIVNTAKVHEDHPLELVYQTALLNGKEPSEAYRFGTPKILKNALAFHGKESGANVQIENAEELKRLQHAYCTRKYFRVLMDSLMKHMCESADDKGDLCAKVREHLKDKPFRGDADPPYGSAKVADITIPSNQESNAMGNEFRLVPFTDEGKVLVGGAENRTENKTLLYNKTSYRPQLFAMLDASAMMWNKRAFFNPGETDRPTTEPKTKHGEVDGMHYWSRTLVESFVVARQRHKTDYPGEVFEVDVKKRPKRAFPVDHIGALCDDTFSRYFQLLPSTDPLRDMLRKVRSLNVLWGTLPSYQGVTSGNMASDTTAWMPLSVANHRALLESVNLFDAAHKIPSNVWTTGDLRRVFMQSYHNCFHVPPTSPAFRDWVKNYCKYRTASDGSGGCFKPFTQYGGTLVTADFVPHRVEKPSRQWKRRHEMLVSNRFGSTKPLRLGGLLDDRGLLQDMFSFEYRPFAKLSPDQTHVKTADAFYASNFMAYARNHAIIALASSNMGTDEASETLVARNLFRLLVDTYECMSHKPDQDGVPVIMGFRPRAVSDASSDRRVVELFAGTVRCVNAKIESQAGSKGLPLYRQSYFNDAAILFTRLLRQNQRKALHARNFQRARLRRRDGFSKEEYMEELVEILCRQIEFLNVIGIELAVKNGATLEGIDLRLLEPREATVPLAAQDDDVVGQDYMSPATIELAKNVDFNNELDSQQMAMLSILPANERLVGLLGYNPHSGVVDMQHVKKKLQERVLKENKRKGDDYIRDLLRAQMAQQILSVSGLDDQGFGFDVPSKPEKLTLQDPIAASEALPDSMFVTGGQLGSSLSMQQRSRDLRTHTSPTSVGHLRPQEYKKVLDRTEAQVQRNIAIAEMTGNTLSYAQALAELKPPRDVYQILMKAHAQGDGSVVMRP